MRCDEAVNLYRGNTARRPDLDPCQLAALEEPIDGRARDTQGRSRFGHREKQTAIDGSAIEGVMLGGYGGVWVVHLIPLR